MALADLLTRIDELQARIVAAGPLSPEAKRKLDYRFRLDWNYHSNAMEGSSLTKLETRTIMLGNVTVDGKPIKDVLEMKGHDDVITKLLQMSSGELHLSEARIKEVHKAIVKEDHPDRQDWPGRWKPEPNHLTNYRGERIDFTPPQQVAEAMHRLLDRTKADIERIERKAPDAPHPALIAFDFHREYVTIHPFHDGNGRTARIFSNLLLMRFGLPPVIIKVEEKEAYNRFLAEVQVYGASPDLFNEFLSDRLLRAQELMLDALEGRELADVDDLQKRADLLFVQAESQRLTEEERTQQRRDLVDRWLENNVVILSSRIVTTFDVFSKFFASHAFRYSFRLADARAALPEIDCVDSKKILELWSKAREKNSIGINLHFVGLKYGNSHWHKEVVGYLRFGDDNVCLGWDQMNFEDVLRYEDPIHAQPLPCMTATANMLFNEIQAAIEKTKQT